MNSCLKSWGDCARAKKRPGWRRTGTRKSRAPSGVPRVRLLVQLEGKRLRRRHDLERVDLELDGAGRQIRVDGLRCAAGDLALGAEDVLVADAVCDGGRPRRALRIHDELADAGVVAQVDEDEAPVVAAPRRPAGEDRRPAGVLLARFAAAQLAPRHPVILSSSPSSGVVQSCLPCSRTVACAPSTTTVQPAPSRAAWV